jgi:pimeloyl-ACP methyl ester carboxylesterase
MTQPHSIEKLVLLPGLHGTGDLFDPLLEALPSSLEPIVVSYPRDRELTGAELIAFVRSHLPLNDPYVLLGESFSSLLATQIAATHPANLRALVLSAGFASCPLRGILRIGMAAALRCLPRSELAVCLPSFLIRRFFAGPGAPESIVRKVQSTVASVHLGVLLSRLRYIDRHDVRAELAQVTVPLLYLQAAADRTVPWQSLEEILAVKPDVTVVRIDGPHLLLQCEAQKSSQAIADFLEHLDPGETSRAI